MIPYKSIESAEQIETPLSTDMVNALNLWYELYLNRAHWLGGDSSVKSLNLPAFISSEIARQIVLEMKWNISVPIPANSSVTDTSRPVSSGTSTVAPNIAKRCCTPRIIIRGVPNSRAS